MGQLSGVAKAYVLLRAKDQPFSHQEGSNTIPLAEQAWRACVAGDVAIL